MAAKSPDTGFDFNKLVKLDQQIHRGVPGVGGSDYLLDGKSVIKLLTQGDAYTLSWRSNPRSTRAIKAAEEVLQEGWNSWLEQSGKSEGHLVLEAVIDTGQELEEQREGLVITKSDGQEVISKRVDPFARLFWSSLSALHLGIYENPPLSASSKPEFGVWLDGKKTPARNGRETAIEAKLGIVPLRTLPELIRTTSPALKNADPDQLKSFIGKIVYEHELDYTAEEQGKINDFAQDIKTTLRGQTEELRPYENRPDWTYDAFMRMYAATRGRDRSLIIRAMGRLIETGNEHPDVAVPVLGFVTSNDLAELEIYVKRLAKKLEPLQDGVNRFHATRAWLEKPLTQSSNS